MNIYRVLILVALSAAVGWIIFLAVRYRSAILVIEARTMDKGKGRVCAEVEENGEHLCRGFEIEDNQGTKKRYVVVLPATRLKFLKIDPLGGEGRFEVNWISLTSDSASYTWGGNGMCSQRMWSEQTIRQEPCSGSFPRVEILKDSSIQISSIPDMGFENTIGMKLFMALFSSVVIFLSGAWLSWPTGEILTMGKARRYALRLLPLILIALYLYQFYYVFMYSVDVPFQDEWFYFDPKALPNGLTWNWLFSFQFDHIIVFTKLIAWLNMKLFEIDFTINKIVTYAIFGGLLLAVARLKEMVAGRGNFTYFLAFMIFLLSPIAHENHFWGFQSQIHLFLLFSVVALYYAYYREPTWKSAVTFSAFLVLGIYNFSGGMPVALVYLACVTCFMVARMAGSRINRASGWRFILISWAITGAALLHFVLKHKIDPKAYYLLPSDVRFWDYFLNALSLGFGYTENGIAPGIVCLLLVAIPIIMLVSNRETRWQHSTWAVLTAISGILAVLGILSVGRGYIAGSKLSRYSEISFLLIPYAALVWWLLIKRTALRNAVLALFWCFCFASYSDDWSYQVYPEMKQDDLETLACVEQYYAGTGKGDCSVHTVPEHLDNAKELGAKFTKRFSSVRNQ